MAHTRKASQSGIVAPTLVTPHFIGQIYYDTVGNQSYISKSKTTGDWVLIGLGDMTKCYDKNTEILTKDGFKYIQEVTEQDSVATLNIETNNIEYQNVKNTFKYDNIPTMYKVKSEQVDLLVTPNHNMLVKKRYSDNFELLLAKDIIGKRVRYKKDGNWIGNEDNFILPGIDNCDDIEIPISIWSEFLGYYLSEGCTIINRTSCGSKDYKSIISQKKESKHKMFECISMLASIIGKKAYINSKKDGTWNIIISSKQLYTYLNEFGYSYEKHVPKEIKNTNKNNINIFLDAYILGDGNINCNGSRKTPSRSIFTSSKKMVSDIQELCLKSGQCGNSKVIANVGDVCGNIDGRDIIAKHTCYSIRLNTKSKNPQVNHGHSKDYKVCEEEFIEFNDSVYCVEVERNNTLYVRRNGKVVWSGNSVYDINLNSIVDSSEQLDDGVGNVVTASEIRNHLDNLSVFGNDFQYADSLGVAVSTSTAFLNKIDFTTTNLPAGNYKIEWSYGWSHDHTRNDFIGEIALDNDFATNNLVMIHRQEPKDSSGSGPGRYISTATNQNFIHSGFRILSLSGVHNFKLRYRTQTNGSESSIWDATIAIYRVS